MLRVGVLASHQGTNFQAIADACADGTLDACVAVLICNNSGAAVMQRAQKAGIPACHLSSATHPDEALLDKAICNALTQAETDLVVLAGYMKKLGPMVLRDFEKRIINVHPSLLPRHGGKGLYGRRVHEAVLAAGDEKTGATVHFVNAEYDKGDILKQESFTIAQGETEASLAGRVHEIEHRLLLDTIKLISRRKVG